MAVHLNEWPFYESTSCYEPEAGWPNSTINYNMSRHDTKQDKQISNLVRVSTI